MFNFHTYHIDDVPCLLNVAPGEAQACLSRLQPRADVALSVGLHPWQVTADWPVHMAAMQADARLARVWAIGECGLDKARGANWAWQVEAFRAQMEVAEEVGKPMVIHCVRAFDELLALRRQLERECRLAGRQAQPWVIHGFRGKPEQAKQMMAKGLLLSFGHRYNADTLRWVFGESDRADAASFSRRPFFFETDDSPVSVRQIYEQAARHLGVDATRLDRLCDARLSLFRQRKIS